MGVTVVTILVIFSIKQVLAVVAFIALLVWLSFLSEKTPKKKVLFFGDSVIQQGAEAGGFISIVESMLQDESIKDIVISASGIGGNTVSDLLDRLDDDALPKNLHSIIIYGGINDAWRYKLTGTYTSPVDFERTCRKIVARLNKNAVKIIFCTPAVIGEKRRGENELDAILDEYGNIIKRIGMEKGFRVVNLRQFFLNYLQENNPLNYDRGILTTDGIHFNVTGNELVAGILVDLLKNL